jgi:hypothetical protein
MAGTLARLADMTVRPAKPSGVLATSRGPGCRILRGMCSAVWLYLGLVAALVLPRHPGSWDCIGGAVAFLVGVGFGVAAWRGSEREVTGSPRRAPAIEQMPAQSGLVVRLSACPFFKVTTRLSVLTSTR